MVAGSASFFSPCSFTVQPSYIAFASGGANVAPGQRVQRVLTNGTVAALGTASRALRIGTGLFAISLAVMNRLDLSHRLPLLGTVAGVGQPRGG